MLEWFNAKQTTAQEWNISKCESCENRKNCLDDIRLNPKCLNNNQSASKIRIE